MRGNDSFISDRSSLISDRTLISDRLLSVTKLLSVIEVLSLIRVTSICMINRVIFYLRIVLYVNEKERCNVYIVRVLEFLFLTFYLTIFPYTSISCRQFLSITDKYF